MTTPNRGSDSVMSVAQQLVQYDDDDDMDERMEASHSKLLGIGRDAELDGRRDAMDRANLNVGGNRVPEAGSGYQGAVDGNGGSDFYQGDPLGLYGTYGTDGDVVSREGAGASHGFPDLQDRVMQETGLDANSSRVNAEAYMPEDSIRPEEHSSFSSLQQLQLRAQILVYGDLIKGILPEESLMSSAFSDEGGSDQSPSGWNWERIWQIAAERESERRELEGHEDDVQEDYDGQTERGATLHVDQGLAVTSGPDTPSGSPFRTAEHFAVAMPQGPAGIMDDPVTSAGGQAADGGGHSMMSTNLDSVVQNIVAGTASLVDGLGSNNAPEFRSARSPSLDPWLKPQLASVGTPAPGSVLEANFPSAHGAATGLSEPANIASSIPLTGTPDKQPLKKGRWGEKQATTPANVEVVPAQENKDDAKTPGSRNARNAKTPAGNQKRGGRGKGRVQAQNAAETAGTSRRTRERKSSGAKGVTEAITPAEFETDKGAKASGARSPPRRALRGKNVADVKTAVGSPVPDSIQPGAEVSDGKASPGTLPQGKEKEQQDGSDLHAQTQTWLEQAKASFNEALAAANSAAEQKEYVESVTAQTNQTPGKDSNQSASVAAAVYAAASVAKAAAEAAKVAYHAALQATCIVADGYGDSGQLGGVGSSDKDGGLGGRKSAIAAAKEEARKRPVVTSPSKTTPQSTDAVLRAARLMAEAASEAGAVLAKGNACTPLTAPEIPLVDSAGIRRGGRGGKKGRLGKEALNFSTPDADGNGSTAKRGKGSTGGKQSLKTGARRVAKAAQELDANPPQTGTPAEKATGRELVQFASSPSHAADVPEIVHQDQIVEGSLVEVMNDEEGLRGGWFTAKVLELKDREVYVQYDEILTDDGSARLKELFPLDGPSEGTEAGRPRIRLISPKNIAREEGRRKRRRTATEQIIWSVGDRVDAYDKDGWWEGIIQGIDEDDEAKVTLHFPAERATSVLKSWNLRPSLFWKDGRWEQWVREGGFQSRLEDDPASKKPKVVQSPKAQARKTGRKVSIPAKTPDEPRGNSRASRRLKELGENVVASPAVTTRSSPRQNIQKKEGRTKIAQETAEVETTPR